MNFDISFVIVSFNTRDLLLDCLDSIHQECRSISHQIIVVDNNSLDGTCEMVQQSFPTVLLIKNQHNAGFSAANNQGIQLAQGKYIFLLNPDTILLPNSVDHLMDFLESNRYYGAVGPRTFLDRNHSLEVCSLKILSPLRAIAIFTRIPFPGKKTILQKCWRLDTKLWEASEPVEVEGIGGAAILTRKSLLMKMKGLDERFFMGYEDTDFAASLNTQKLKIAIHPNARIVHLFGQAKKHPNAPKQKVYAWKKAPLQFIRKYYGLPAVLLFHLFKLADSIAKSLKPKPSQKLIHTHYKNKADIVIQWPGNPQEDYLFEISNDVPFFDKFGSKVTGCEMVLPVDLWQRLSSGIYYWRVFKWPHSQFPEVLFKGIIRTNT